MVDWKTMQKTYGGILAAVFIVLILVLSVVPTGYAVAGKTTTSGKTWWPLSIIKSAITAPPKVNTAVGGTSIILSLPINNIKLTISPPNAFGKATGIPYPSFRIVKSPKNPVIGQPATITVSATHSKKIDTIVIYLDEILVKKCFVNALFGSCSHTASYSSKDHHNFHAQINFDNNANAIDYYGSIYVIDPNKEPRNDMTPPQVSPSYSPANPKVGQTLFSSVSATDNNLIGSIDMYYGDRGPSLIKLKLCSPNTKNAICSATTPALPKEDFVELFSVVSDARDPSSSYLGNQVSIFDFITVVSGSSGGGGGGGGDCVKKPCTVIQ